MTVKLHNGKTSVKSRQIMQAMLVVLAELCAVKYSTVNDEVDIGGDISDHTLRQIAPTTNDLAVALGDMSVYQARYLLLKLVDEGSVIKTGVSKGLPIHWWLIGADKTP